MIFPSSIAMPPMALIPGGVFNGNPIEPFNLGRTPVTNAEYAAHVDRFSDTPFVLLATSPDTHVTSLVARGRNPQDLLGDFAERLSKRWDTRNPMTSVTLTLFQLTKDMSPVDFGLSNQPVTKVSWFHAFEYCVNDGLFLPSDDQWSYAAGVHQGLDYATSKGKLYAEDGKTKLAHFDENGACDVDDRRYPDGPHGLRHMTGNVCEWTARNPSGEGTYGLRGGHFSWDEQDMLRSEYSVRDNLPHVRYDIAGFRVAARPFGRAS